MLGFHWRTHLEGEERCIKNFSQYNVEDKKTDIQHPLTALVTTTENKYIALYANIEKVLLTFVKHTRYWNRRCISDTVSTFMTLLLALSL